MTFKLSNYYKPTPILMRKIGDSLFGASLSIAGCAIVNEMKWLALTGLALGIVGKFLTNLFVDNKDIEVKNIQADLPPVQPDPTNPRPR